MLRKSTSMLILLMLAAAGLWGQGLNTPPGVTKDDWEEINFEFNSSVLVDGFPSLLRLGELLQKNPGYKVRIEGHTDVIGNKAYNDKLGLARASAVRDFLVKYGASASQIEVTSLGKDDSRYPGQKSTFTKTDEARWMNRRVGLTVLDAQGKPVSAGGAGDAIRAIEPAKPAPASSLADCCSEVLKRLDKLDDIAKMLKDLGDQNADLRKQLADLKAAQDAMKQGQQVLESKVNEAPKPPSAAEVAAEVNKNKDPRFQMLSMNVGADNTGNLTFTGKGRYFAPFGDHFAFEAQGEYLYYKTQQEGQFDFGLVDRMGKIQAGLFGSLKHVDIAGDQNGGNLGQASLDVDYIFGRGKVGFFGSKGFWNSGVINSVNATDPVTGALLNHLFLNSYLSVVDQAGVNGTIGLWGNNYIDGNIGYLHGVLAGNRVGGTARFVFPINNHVAFTVEGGLNETLIGSGNTGRAVVGLMLSNMLRPKEFQAANHALPMDPPRIRYEVITKKVRNGDDPPVADAGPPQVGVAAGTVTLNGSASYSPDGLPIKYQWVQEVGPTVTLSAPNAAVTTFTAVASQYYAFRLVVTDSLGAQGIARTTVTSATPQVSTINISFTANPTNINNGQSSTLTWAVTGATSVSISPGIGTVALQGSAPVSPTTTTTYVLTASNGATQQTAQTVVVVGSNQPMVQFCYATPTNIMAGESATLNWATVNASGVSIAPTVGAVANSGNIAVSPTQTTTYVITATGTGGTANTNTCSVTVTVAAGSLPRVIQFSASPATISSGQSSSLLWVVENATSVSISNGVGANLSLGGTQSVSPTATTTYTLTATNSAGSVTASTTINVNVVPPPTITSFTATPNPSPAPGTKVTLNCNTTGATSITMAGVLFLQPNPTFVVFPTTTTTYSCVATNSAGMTATQSLTVTVNGSGTAPPPYDGPQ